LEQETGNPIFDYRAGFRKTAEKIQRVLISGGLLLFLSCGIAFLFAKLADQARMIIGIASVAGIVLVICGVSWAFYWRKKLRAEFCEKFGPK
jgi:hypothetical protein